MTLHEITMLTAFNAWATSRIFNALEGLNPDDVTRDMNASHGSILGTLTHLVAAEKLWLSRWLGTPDARMLAPADVPTLADLKAIWEKVGYETARFLGTMTDRKLQEKFTTKNARGETLTPVLWQSIQHVVDHSTYHRGQVITLMRQCGAAPPSTGLLTFYRDSTRRP